MPRFTTLIALGATAFALYAGTHQQDAADLLREAARTLWSIIHLG